MLRNKRSFTLIELIFSVAIMSLILLSLYATFVSSLKLYEYISGNENPARSEIAYALTGDLKSVYMPRATGFPGDFTGRIDRMSFIATRPLTQGAPGDEKGVLAEVEYIFEGESGGRLIRRSRSYSPLESRGAWKTDREWDIGFIRMFYHDGQEWRNAWTSAERPPRGVKAVFRADGPSEGSGYDIIIDLTRR
jgi:hypothetical protein